MSGPLFTPLLGRPWQNSLDLSVARLIGHVLQRRTPAQPQHIRWPRSPCSSTELDQLAQQLWKTLSIAVPGVPNHPAAGLVRLEACWIVFARVETPCVRCAQVIFAKVETKTQEHNNKKPTKPPWSQALADESAQTPQSLNWPWSNEVNRYVLVTIVSRNCESRRSCGLW